MIPLFPKFKKLELSDKANIKKFTTQYPPYSDFNFTSLWSWNTKGEISISMLHDNLIVHFTHYITNKPFYSFLGKEKINETLRHLFELCIAEGKEPVVYFISDEAAPFVDKDEFIVEEDRDNFDYVYDLDLVSEYKGSIFSDKRNKVSSFVKNFPHVHVKVLDLKDSLVREKISRLNEEWRARKLEKNAEFQTSEEIQAITNFFQLDMTDTLGVGVFANDKLIGYSIFEILEDGYTLCHFSKADINFKSVYDYLMRESAKILKEMGHSFLNYEQDLGVPGLRYKKNSFRPTYLRKFKVSSSYGSQN